jgi:protein-tyrosine phosphatase
MQPEVYWIEMPMGGRSAIMPRRRAEDWLDDEIDGWRDEGVDIVISLLELSEIHELRLGREADLCSKQRIEFFSFPVADRSASSLRDAASLCQLMALRIDQKKAIAIHCRAGIGRSSLLAASILVCMGLDPDTAFDMIGKARGVRVPDTEEQRFWLASFQESYATMPSSGLVARGATRRA